jgi:hypothetical protein
VEFASAGAVGKIDRAQEALDRGKITRGQYWKKTSLAVGESAAVMAAGMGAGGIAARGAQELGMGIRATSALAGASGGVGGQFASDAFENAVGEKKGLSSWKQYAMSGTVGGLFGYAEGVKTEQASQFSVKTENGVNAEAKATNREYIPEDVTESVAAQRAQPANSVEVPQAHGPSRISAIREALSDANGKLLPKVERVGVKSTIRAIEEQGFELQGSIKYRGNQGIDLAFKGTGTNNGRYALAEAKASSGLGALKNDMFGIRQGSYEFFRTRLARGIAYGDTNMRPVYRSLYEELRTGGVDLYGGFAGSDRLFKFDPNVFNRTVNFRTTPNAATMVK